MPIPVSSGYPDYSGGTSNYIVPVFSSKVLKKFYSATVLNEICSTEYLGEIKSQGDTVTITTDPDVTIRNYSKGMDLVIETLESPSFDLVVKYAKYFNFMLDDVDEYQMFIKRLDRWADNASKRMKIVVERELFLEYASENLSQEIDTYNKGSNAGKISQNINLGDETTDGVAITRNNILEYFVRINQILDEQDIPRDGNRWVILPTWASSLIKLSELRDASISGLGQSILLNGRIGKIDDITIYTSNLLPTVTVNTKNCTIIPFGHKEGLAFVTQLTKVETYRPEKKFANAIKGLQVYGFEIVYPQMVGKLVAYEG